MHRAFIYDIKTNNGHNCMKVYYTHCIPPTRLGHSCGHLQGDVVSICSHYLLSINKF